MKDEFHRFMVIVKNNKIIAKTVIPFGTSAETRKSIIADMSIFNNDILEGYDFYFLDSDHPNKENVDGRDELAIGCEPDHKNRCVIDVNTLSIIERTPFDMLSSNIGLH